jgi:hypothetical protein
VRTGKPARIERRWLQRGSVGKNLENTGRSGGRLRQRQQLERQTRQAAVALMCPAYKTSRERIKEKEVSNWAKELGCARDRAGPVMTEGDGLSGKKIKWADLIFLNSVSIIY